MYPSDFRYTKDHEWLQVSGATGTIGITDYAQHALGDVVFVELPKVGAKLKAGEVTEVNSELANTPEKINQDPHRFAWLVKIKIDNPQDAAKLMDAKAYQEYVAEKEKEQTV